jgi:predicted nucleic acid-binding protein
MQIGQQLADIAASPTNAEIVERARSLFLQIRITRCAAASLADRVWSLRHDMTAYDATYIALAEVLACPLVTRDEKLNGTDHGTDVRLYGRPG